jgi:hypothetical protein
MPIAKPMILFVNLPSRRTIGAPASLSIAANGWEVLSAANIEAAVALLQAKDVSVLVSNVPNVDLFSKAKTHNPKIINILVTELPMFEYSKELDDREVGLLDHVVANLTQEWTLTDLAITLRKIIQTDLFGLEKYLRPSSVIHSMAVTGSSSRGPCNKTVSEWVDDCGLNKNISRVAFGICEELVMNAIFDAPMAGGKNKYALIERSQPRELDPDDCATLRYGADDRVVAISITDPFGAFKRDTWFNYMRKVLKRHDDNLIDSKIGGAGLGLFKILYGSHNLICNVQPGKTTEVIVLISINQPLRDFDHMPRSIHYFSTASHTTVF